MFFARDVWCIADVLSVSPRQSRARNVSYTPNVQLTRQRKKTIFFKTSLPVLFPHTQRRLVAKYPYLHGVMNVLIFSVAFSYDSPNQNCPRKLVFAEALSIIGLRDKLYVSRTPTKCVLFSWLLKQPTTKRSFVRAGAINTFVYYNPRMTKRLLN